jgi:hypothetical protein
MAFQPEYNSPLFCQSQNADPCHLLARDPLLRPLVHGSLRTPDRRLGETSRQYCNFWSRASQRRSVVDVLLGPKSWSWSDRPRIIAQRKRGNAYANAGSM